MLKPKEISTINVRPGAISVFQEMVSTNALRHKLFISFLPFPRAMDLRHRSLQEEPSLPWSIGSAYQVRLQTRQHVCENRPFQVVHSAPRPPLCSMANGP